MRMMMIIIIIIIIIVCLFNVDTKNKVKNYNKKKRNSSIKDRLQYIKW